jgi:hypothetical protein
VARNRRRSPRIRAKGLVVHIVAANLRRACLVENISIGGLFARTDMDLPLNSLVRIEMAHPGWKKMMLLGARVMNRVDPGSAQQSSMPPGIGLQFVGPPRDERVRLEALLEELGMPTDVAQAQSASEGTDMDLQAVKVPVEPPALEVVALIEVPPDEQPAAPPPPAPPPPPPPGGTPERELLLMQIRGLLMELGEAHMALQKKDLLIEELQAELSRYR